MKYYIKSTRSPVYFAHKFKHQALNVNVSANTPFFGMSDDVCTVNRFVKALYKRRKDEATSYISKNFVKYLDLEDLQKCLEMSNNYKNLINIQFETGPKNCKTNSIVLLSEGKNTIIHLHMIKEPDLFGNWKIYGIEKE